MAASLVLSPVPSVNGFMDDDGKRTPAMDYIDTNVKVGIEFAVW